MATPHNAANMGDIAETILLPGDPLRAKVIAETFLENPVQFNTVRNMFGYTGTYKGKKVSVMGTGMGMPSIGIYSHELIQFYGVKNLIRVGSCGATQENARLGTILMAQGACTDSNYVHQYNLPGTFSAIADFTLLKTAQEMAAEYSFNAQQNEYLSELLSDEYASLWNSVMYGIASGNGEIIVLNNTGACCFIKPVCITCRRCIV